jgi:hypothetical protein
MKRRIWYTGWGIALAVVALAGCGGGQAATAPADTGASGAYTSEVLNASYPDALDAANQLALGTMLLEQTENAVTPEQAAALLPLWQALQAGGVTAQAEVNAVLKQIEGTMTSEQLQAIAAMQLTQEDMRTWMEEQGLGTQGGFPGAGGDLTEEEREALRATAQAGGGMPGSGEGMPPGGGEMPPEMATRQAEMANMSEEEREAMRATAQAGGGFPGAGGGRGGPTGRQSSFLLNPLIELLEVRAGEG